jgi:LPS sulfotransferase NodH
VHSNQIIEPYWSNIKSSFFVIGLYRRNLVEKIASAYIALQQQRYVSLVENIGEKYTVALDLEQITHVTRHVLELEAAYQLHSAGACQLELAYEDIVDQFVTSDTVPTVQPDNYDEITAAVMQQLEMSRMII